MMKEAHVSKIILKLTREIYQFWAIDEEKNLRREEEEETKWGIMNRCAIKTVQMVSGIGQQASFKTNLNLNSIQFTSSRNNVHCTNMQPK